MDITEALTNKTTSSRLTYESGPCTGAGSHKLMTVRSAEFKDRSINPANFESIPRPVLNREFSISRITPGAIRKCSAKSMFSNCTQFNNTRASGTNPKALDDLTAFTESTINHSLPDIQNAIRRKDKTTDNQIVDINSGDSAVNQPKLLELLSSKHIEKQRLVAELKRLDQQFDKLHINSGLMDKVDKFKIKINKYINRQTLNGEKYNTQYDAQLRKEIADDIQSLARDIAIWAGIEKDNLEVLTYIIEQGFPIRQTSVWVDPNPESTVYLPFDTMNKLVDNCSPICPDLLFVKAIFADADTRFDMLTETILTSRTVNEGLFQEAIAQSIPTASYRRLMVFFNYLRGECNTSRMIEDIIRHSYRNHKLSNRASVNRYKNSFIMVFVLEAIAQHSREEARKLIGLFCKNEQQPIAMAALLGGLHQSTEIMNEMGINLTRQAFKEASVSLENSLFLMAKEAGLTNERLFASTVNRFAPYLWILPNKYGKHLHQQCRFPDKIELDFIHFVVEQMSTSQEGSCELKHWSGPAYKKQLVLGDVSLWAGKIFTVMNDVVWTNSSDLLQQNAEYSEPWNILISKAKCCNGLNRPDDFMKFMDWLLIDGLSWIRTESEHRKKEATFTTKLKSYRPDLWPDPHNEALTTSPVSYDRFVAYTRSVTTLHFDIIESFLRLAPQSHRIHVIKNWLTNPHCAKQRETLFPNPVHPLNNMESPNIWQLLLSLDKDYQPQENQFDNDWQKLGSPQGWTEPPTTASFMDKSILVNGRTLAIQHTDDGWDYLKFLSDMERPEELTKEGDKINLMAEIASRHGLKSSIPKVVGKYRWDDVQNNLVTFTSPAKKAKLEEKCRFVDGKTGYCLHLKSTKDAPYHLYPYDLNPVTEADQIVDGLYKYAHDCGLLFSRGLYAPAVMAADHDSVTNRKHHVLSSYVGATSEGRMLQWTKAAQHPNVGLVGMRDSGDTKSMIELGEDYFFSSRCQKFLDFEKSEDRAKVAFSELAKNAQGLILQYALCFQKQFDSDNSESVLIHEHKLKTILVTLFHQAFPLFTEEQVSQAMNEDGLLSRAVREIIYWCGHGARFVNDIQQNIIPKSIYPTCSETANIVNEEKLDPRELVPGVGFVTRDNQPNLGVTFGVNPLVMLNALIVKLLASGVLTSL
ncbi:hypothetical protein [Endozoicomonas sp. SCSIO W0465]|uniref:hypothetical protein n=1 Tax=Endozoicomonas sp. SCSIO W0465 TaxID=2918516 RepID=UPI0020758560|nr:hypothetical protein [Endozoicomonas sp. SCSIO W0465]USE33788.1 hypothetical protein MJO57_16545 [Endozoicomonas sp. SCSIO W0465]